MNCKAVVLSASLLLGVSVGACAQVGVYGMISTERVSGVNCLASASQVTPTPCSSSDRIDRAVGAGGGIYYDFMKIGPATIGADVRGEVQKSNKSASTTIAGNNALRMDGALGGARAAFSFRRGTLKPYAEAAVGWNRRSSGLCGTSTIKCNADFLAYRAFFGLDITALPFMDIRLPEVGIGQNIGFSGTSSNFVESAQVGIVFHLPRR